MMKSTRTPAVGTLPRPAEASGGVESPEQELARLRGENLQLQTRLRMKSEYIRQRANSLLEVMGTSHLRPDELDDDTLLELDPLGIIIDSFSHILENLRQKNNLLHLANEEMAAIFASLEVGLMVVDPLKRIISCNAKMNELFPRTETESSRQPAHTCAELVCYGSIAAESCAVERILAGEPLSRLRDWHYCGRHFDVVASPIYAEDGTVDSIVVVYNDVSELRLAQEQLRTLNRELEQRVRERTVQLDATNRELEAFAYSVSHDLRAPLRGINGFSLALLEEYGDLLDDTGRSYLLRIRNGCGKMGQLIDDLLQLSRLTRSGIQRKKINLSALVASILTELAEGSPERRVEVSITPDISCHGDPALLRAVLGNLLANAWKFTRTSGEARIEFGVTGKEGRTIYWVRDNGAGFDMRYRDKLFVPFQRLHRADEFEGTGIGLATVQRAVHRHGGEIWAEGSVGEGAVFYFTLSGEEQ